MIFWIVGLLDEHRAWRSVCVACCGLVVWKVVICVCDAMSGDGFDEAMDLLDRWIRGRRQRGEVMDAELAGWRILDVWFA